ncbi:MAG: Ger(x)C family spore germination protein [Firmicutes bacterium]|nr:Ger(x)C family spore germination protein [Bacillota bacterium]
MRRGICAALFTTLLLAGLSAALTGCWDLEEISEQGMVLGAAVDADRQPRSFRLTLEIPRVSEFAAAGGGGGGGGGRAPEKPAWVVSGQGTALYDIVRQLQTRVNRRFFLGHVRVLVIGEELARRGLLPVMDFFERNPQLAYRTPVLIAAGKAEDALKVRPRLEKLASTYLRTLSDKSRVAGRAPQVMLGEILGPLHERKDFLLPRLVSSEKEAQLSGAAVIRGGSLAGWLSPGQTRGALFVEGKMAGELEAAIGPAGQTAVYDVSTVHSKLSSTWVGGTPLIRISIRSEGTLTESTATAALRTPGSILRLEQALARQINREVRQAVEQLQALGADALGFGDLLHRQHPAQWKKTQTRWHELFRSTSVEVSSVVRIRRIGASF